MKHSLHKFLTTEVTSSSCLFCTGVVQKPKLYGSTSRTTKTSTKSSQSQSWIQRMFNIFCDKWRRGLNSQNRLWLIECLYMSQTNLLTKCWCPVSQNKSRNVPVTLCAFLSGLGVSGSITKPHAAFYNRSDPAGNSVRSVCHNRIIPSHLLGVSNSAAAFVCLTRPSPDVFPALVLHSSCDTGHVFSDLVRLQHVLIKFSHLLSVHSLSIWDSSLMNVVFVEGLWTD